MILYTIGFTQKSAREFFTLLKDAGVQRLVDIRIYPQGQLAGFARQDDLPYFLQELAGDCEYLYLPLLAPTKELMHFYREGKDWQSYKDRFEALMEERHVPTSLDRSIFESKTCCLLCSEADPELCHRRLVAERLQRHWPGVEIRHL